jgi:hypothetical protein
MTATKTTPNADKVCNPCANTNRVHACERCYAQRCPHYAKQTATGYICNTPCGTGTSADAEVYVGLKYNRPSDGKEVEVEAIKAGMTRIAIRIAPRRIIRNLRSVEQVKKDIAEIKDAFAAAAKKPAKRKWANEVYANLLPALETVNQYMREAREQNMLHLAKALEKASDAIIEAQDEAKVAGVIHGTPRAN